MLDCLCSDECGNIFVFCREEVFDVSNDSCTPGFWLVASLAARLICVLLEFVSNGADFAAVNTIKNWQETMLLFRLE